jgi:hypothetical protein
MLDVDGATVPICRTRRKNVVRHVASAALDDVRATAHAESDDVLALLLRQEADRLERGLVALGLAGMAINEY